MSFGYFENGNHVIGHIYPIFTPVGVVGIAPLDSGIKVSSLESNLRKLQEGSHKPVPETLVEMIGEGNKGALTLWLNHFPNGQDSQMLRLVYMLDGKILDERTKNVIYIAVAAHLPDAKGVAVDYRGIFVDGEQIAGMSLKNGIPNTSNESMLIRLGSHLENEYGNILSSIPIRIRVPGYDKQGEVVHTQIERKLEIKSTFQRIEATLI